MEHSDRTLKMAKFCKDTCPGCKMARAKGKGFVYTFVKLESRLCPMCRAYKKVYGKPAYEK